MTPLLVLQGAVLFDFSYALRLLENASETLARPKQDVQSVVPIPTKAPRNLDHDVLATCGFRTDGMLAAQSIDAANLNVSFVSCTSAPKVSAALIRKWQLMDAVHRNPSYLF